MSAHWPAGSAFLCVVSPVIGGRGVGAAGPGGGRSRSWRSRGASSWPAAAGAGNTLVNAVQFDQELRPGSQMRTAVFNELSTRSRGELERGLRSEAARAAGRRAGGGPGHRLSLGRDAAGGVRQLLVPGLFAGRPHRAADPHPAGPAHAREHERHARHAGRSGGDPGGRDPAHGLGVVSRDGRLLAARTDEPRGRRALLFFPLAKRDAIAAVLSWRRATWRRRSTRSRCGRGRRSRPSAPRSSRRLTRNCPSERVSGVKALEGVLAGSKVALTLDFNNPVESMTALDDRAQIYPANRLSGNRWSVDLPIVRQPHADPGVSRSG